MYTINKIGNFITQKWNKKKESKTVKEKLPETLEKLNIRVSTPYGAYPEDVETVVSDLLEKVNKLETTNAELSKKNTQLERDLHLVNTEVGKMKIDVSLMSIPETTEEEDSKMLRELNKITKAEDDEDFDIEIVEE